MEKYLFETFVAFFKLNLCKYIFFQFGEKELIL